MRTINPNVALMERARFNGELPQEQSRKDRICRLTCHDWFALSYHPAPRRECLRCHVIEEFAAEEAPVGTSTTGS